MARGETDTVARRAPTSVVRRVGAGVGLLLLALSALYGGNAFSLRDRVEGPGAPAPRPAAVARARATSPSTVPDVTRVRSQPWWQEVATLRGTGTGRAPAFRIDEGALQWRATWSCQRGRLVVASPARRDHLVEASCPATGTAYATSVGRNQLQVRADGPWALRIDQQIDVPLVEPPLPGMGDAGAEVATGDFYGMDQSARGDLLLYRLGDGHALRLDQFFVTPNVDLEIHLSPLAEPRTTEEFMEAGSTFVAPLDITAGSMNFEVPAGVDPLAYRSVVIWCPLIDSAYGAATIAWRT